MNPEEFGFKEYVIVIGHIAIRYYVYFETYDASKGTFLYFQGSGPVALCIEDLGEYRLSFSLHKYSQLTENFNFVIIGKPGFKFCEKNGYEPKEYNELLSLQFRTLQGDVVIADLRKRDISNATTMLLCGHSEGSDVAVNLSLTNPSVTHLVFLSGGGPSQYFDFIIEVRKKILVCEISFSEGQRQIDSLYNVFREIQNLKTSTSKFWKGHSYLRWSSFATAPLEHLKHLDIPIYVGVGSKDKVVHLESLDLIILEFILQGKNNLTYQIFEGCDHGYQSLDGDKKVNHLSILIDSILKWYFETDISSN